MKKQEIEKLVDSWNWNLSVWDMYEYLKEQTPKDQSNILSHCADYFKDKQSYIYFKDMAYHFNVELYESLEKAMKENRKTT
tara:strand:+ start:276 stop:518 length:243 start_codon:yes stop_codon:yes gene_type:complete